MKGVTCISHVKADVEETNTNKLAKIAAFCRGNQRLFMVGQFFCSSEGFNPWKHGCSCKRGGTKSDAAGFNPALPVVQEKMREGWRGNEHMPAYTRTCFLLFRKEKKETRRCF